MDISAIKGLARRAVQVLSKGWALALSWDKAWAPWGLDSLVDGWGVGTVNGFLMKGYGYGADGSGRATGKGDGGLGDRELALGMVLAFALGGLGRAPMLFF